MSHNNCRPAEYQTVYASYEAQFEADGKVNVDMSFGSIIEKYLIVW